MIGFQNCGTADSPAARASASSAPPTPPAAAAPAAATKMTLQEYQFNSGRYFFSGNSAEQALVEGNASLAAVKKGTIQIYLNPEISTVQLHRFFITVSASHFYSSDPDIVAKLSATPALQNVFRYDGIQGYVLRPTPAEMPAGEGNQTCPSPSVPIYRLFKSDAVASNTSHRYTSQLTVRDSLKTAGWTYEGVEFCAVQANTLN